jgi:RNA polymerase sigma factor (sigma-70 family)
MRPLDTSLGGSANAFPATSADLVDRLRSPEGFEALCRDYWRPVYAYIRIAQARSNEDAKDLTQAFFTWLLEGDALRKYEPEKGGFRPYLKVLLRRFLAHSDEAIAALKRGGGTRTFSFDALPEGFDPTSSDPESLFDQAWRNDVVRRAVEEVRRRRIAKEDAVAVRVYESYVLSSSSGQQTYADLARTLGLTEAAVKACLVRMRRDVQEEIRRQLCRMTANDDELAVEWNALFRR